jgi:hypothetical protein
MNSTPEGLGMVPLEIDDEDEIPCVADPIWVRESAPVLAFLSASGPKNWDEINAWAAALRMNGTVLRHCVAWLEEKGLARSYIEATKTMWVATTH